MTIEEAKEYFGENFIEPKLGELCEERNKYNGRTRQSRAVKGEKYLYFYDEFQTEFVEQFGKPFGYVIGTCVFRRHNIAFFKFEGSKDKNFQYEFYDGNNARELIPLKISCKKFHLDKKMTFPYKTYNGLVTFID